jgi:hypothetical protein
VGILAEIQIHTYHESSQKPIYAIREILDAQNGNEPVKKA